MVLDLEVVNELEHIHQETGNLQKKSEKLLGKLGFKNPESINKEKISFSTIKQIRLFHERTLKEAQYGGKALYFMIETDTNNFVAIAHEINDHKMDTESTVYMPTLNEQCKLLFAQYILAHKAKFRELEYLDPNPENTIEILSAAITRKKQEDLVGKQSEDVAAIVKIALDSIESYATSNWSERDCGQIQAMYHFIKQDMKTSSFKSLATKLNKLAKQLVQKKIPDHYAEVLGQAINTVKSAPQP